MTDFEFIMMVWALSTIVGFIIILKYQRYRATRKEGWKVFMDGLGKY